MKLFSGATSFFRKPYRFAAVYGGLLAVCLAFVLLDAFVIPRTYADLVPPAAAETTPEKGEAVITATSYRDDQISITIDTLRVEGTTVYVADITLSDPSLLKTALAGNAYGRNITQTTSDMAEAHDAILAINGDYYGFRNTGYVLRNGVAYRGTGSGDALVMDAQGNLSVISQGKVTVEALAAQGAWQVWAFGPVLVQDGVIAVAKNTEIDGQAMASNPRTAIGQVGENHYIFIVSNGRTKTEAGLSLYQLAAVFEQYGCQVAYNMDGGGSSTMVFMGEVLNQPTTSGKNASERKVSDIVYIGYTQ